jgi:hypothetical protein
VVHTTLKCGVGTKLWYEGSHWSAHTLYNRCCCGKIMAGFDNSGLKQESIEPAPCFSMVIMNALTLTITILMVSRKMKSLKRLRGMRCWPEYTTLKCGVGTKLRDEGSHWSAHTFYNRCCCGKIMGGFDNSSLKQESIEPAPCFSMVVLKCPLFTLTILMVSRKMKSLKRLREIPCWVVHTTLKCGVGTRVLVKNIICFSIFKWRCWQRYDVGAKYQDAMYQQLSQHHASAWWL